MWPKPWFPDQLADSNGSDCTDPVWCLPLNKILVLLDPATIDYLRWGNLMCETKRAGRAVLLINASAVFTTIEKVCSHCQSETKNKSIKFCIKHWKNLFNYQFDQIPRGWLERCCSWGWCPAQAAAPGTPDCADGCCRSIARRWTLICVRACTGFPAAGEDGLGAF